MRQVIFILFAFVVFAACNNHPDQPADNIDSNNPEPAVLSYHILKVYPHDTSSYTEGLLLYQNELYESGGEYGTSKIFRADPTNGKALQELKLDKAFFGEGISILHDTIYQLTYKEHKVFVYDLKTFRKLREMEWPYEGWGMTTDGKDLIISTGSSNLYYVRPSDFTILKTVGVTDNYGPVSNINELEWVDGMIYANKYLTSEILKIDPDSGKVVAQADLTNIMNKSGMPFDPSHIDFMNGIAYDAASKTFYITGKYWPAMFQVELN